MTDYSNIIIYKIYCKDTTIKFVYIGKTRNFKNRNDCHKTNCTNLQDVYVYNFINSHGGWYNWDMVEIAKSNFTDKLSVLTYEKQHIESFEYVLNRISLNYPPHQEY